MNAWGIAALVTLSVLAIVIILGIVYGAKVTGILTRNSDEQPPLTPFS